MKKIKTITIVILLINILLLLSGCKDNSQEELKDKVISELGYVNIKIIDMLNSLNNITFENYTIISKQVKLDDESQKKQSKEGEGSSSASGLNGGENGSSGSGSSSGQQNETQDLINTTEMISDTILTKDRNDIDWQIIQPEIEMLNESWSIIVLDLYSLNTNSETILDFSSKLNNVMVAIKNEDKSASLTSLAALYQSIPTFLQEIGADENLQKIRQTQSYVINAYSIAEDMTNLDINNNIQKAVDIYSEVISNIDYTKDKTFKTNKAYVLLNELLNSLELEDSDIFYVKYKNFMETINEI